MKRSNRKNNEEGNGLNGLLAGLMFLAGLLLGGAIGVVTTLLLAPQSGKKTRRLILRKGRDWQEQATDAVDETVAQVRVKAKNATTKVLDQAESLQQRGQHVIDEGKERFAVAVEAGKTAVNGA